MKNNCYTIAFAISILSSLFINTVNSQTFTKFFREHSKSGTAQPGLFRNESITITGFIRAGLKTATGAHLDEVIIRFSDEPSLKKNEINQYDALSINEGSQVISSLKGTNRLAIQTRPSGFVYDTVLLRVTSSTQ